MGLLSKAHCCIGHNLHLVDENDHPVAMTQRVETGTTRFAQQTRLVGMGKSTTLTRLRQAGPAKRTDVHTKLFHGKGSVFQADNNFAVKKAPSCVGADRGSGLTRPLVSPPLAINQARTKVKLPQGYDTSQGYATPTNVVPPPAPSHSAWRWRQRSTLAFGAKSLVFNLLAQSLVFSLGLFVSSG